jgi:CubicO group peptidase (beta-lactamase class C family)
MKKIFKVLISIFLLFIIYFYFALYPKFDIISGFSSKSIASHLFISNRNQNQTEIEDNNIPSMNLASNKVDAKSKTVTSSVYGLKKRKAIYIDKLGAVLIPHGKENKPLKIPIPKRAKANIEKSFPYGELPQKDTVFANIDYSKLKNAILNAFDKKNENTKKTRAVLVVYKNQIIGEKYKKGFDKNSILLGWSMTKSITSAVLGVLEKQEKITLNQSNLFKEWEQDERKNITLKNLLNMNSGLEWEENYNRISDVTKMLFLADDMSKIQLNKKQIGKPNESWNYSSGTTNLLSNFIFNQFNSHQQYMDFWYTDLIDKVGMHSMIIEPDFSGKYVGSSYGWATARDWAKFGLLYLHNGNWNGEQILNKSWVDFSRKPTNTSNGMYGGHFWLNANGTYPDVPKDLYSANGYQGQHVFIIPSKDLVIVKFGLEENPVFDNNKFLSEIISAIH